MGKIKGKAIRMIWVSENAYQVLRRKAFRENSTISGVASKIIEAKQ